MKSHREQTIPRSNVQRFSAGKHKFSMRQLTAHDAETYLTFFNRLDAPTIRCRYGHMVSQLTLDAAVKIASLDPTWEPAIAVFTEDESSIVALGRFHADPIQSSAEIAVVVDSSMRRLGLGKILLESLIEQAEQRGLAQLHAYVVTKNAPIQKLLRTLGFEMQEAVPATFSEEEDIKFTLTLVA
ncbi:N-acetyltransferase family protein [Bremerella sp.]|uniref:GNAT family N-acetyltransferase n=1 Tax=Bremerella sp. TaxID=2795602 RepID=UPI003919DC3F